MHFPTIIDDPYCEQSGAPASSSHYSEFDLPQCSDQSSSVLHHHSLAPDATFVLDGIENSPRFSSLAISSCNETSVFVSPSILSDQLRTSASPQAASSSAHSVLLTDPEGSPSSLSGLQCPISDRSPIDYPDLFTDLSLASDSCSVLDHTFVASSSDNDNENSSVSHADLSTDCSFSVQQLAADHQIDIADVSAPESPIQGYGVIGHLSSSLDVSCPSPPVLGEGVIGH